MTKIEPVKVYVIEEMFEDGRTPIGVSGVYREWSAAEAARGRLGPFHCTTERWAIFDEVGHDASGDRRVFLLNGSHLDRPEAVKINVIFKEEAERHRQSAISKLTEEELKALGINTAKLKPF